MRDEVSFFHTGVCFPRPLFEKGENFLHVLLHLELGLYKFLGSGSGFCVAGSI